jgi:CPA1 family monovalent cation:H+ antiporter
MTFVDISKISILFVFGGIIIGIFAGYVAHTLFCWTDDKFVEALLSFIVVFGGYRVAEELGSSGVLATVFSGLILNYRCKNYGGLGDLSVDTLDTLWEFVGFITQSFAFIFIGMHTDTDILFSYSGVIFVLFSFILFARYIMVKIVSRIIFHSRKKVIPDNWVLGMTWSGLKGGVSVVLALGIANLGFNNGEELVALTFGIVLLSNIFQGISMPVVVKRLNLLEAKKLE